MNITMSKEISIKATTQQVRKVGSSYAMVSSCAFEGIEWGVVKVLDILQGADIPKNGNEDYIENWLADPSDTDRTERHRLEACLWVKFKYTSIIGSTGLSYEDEDYMPAEIFIEHTLDR